MKRDSCGVSGSSRTAGPWQEGWETRSVLCHRRIPSVSERVFGCREMFSRRPTADAVSRWGGQGKGRGWLWPSLLRKQQGFFYFIFFLSLKTAASECRHWLCQQRVCASQMQSVVSFTPHIVSHRTYEVACSQISHLAPPTRCSSWVAQIHCL